MDAEAALYGAPEKKPKRKTKTERLKDQTFHEVKHNPPDRVYATEEKRGKKAADKQRIAIALDKARQKGARILKK